jgi:hypothetical protein
VDHETNEDGSEFKLYDVIRQRVVANEPIYICGQSVPVSMQKIATFAPEEKVAELLAKYDKD